MYSLKCSKSSSKKIERFESKNLKPFLFHKKQILLMQLAPIKHSNGQYLISNLLSYKQSLLIAVSTSKRGIQQAKSYFASSNILRSNPQIWSCVILKYAVFIGTLKRDAVLLPVFSCVFIANQLLHFGNVRFLVFSICLLQLIVSIYYREK